MEVRSVLPPDAIPSVDDPVFGPEYVGEPDDEVVVVDRPGNRARAYPVRILHYHEIVNDRIDGRPVAVTWCPLCGSAAVYDATVDGRALTFGVSGKLADDDLVMYDRETGSEWKQSLGRAIAGELEGRELELLPAPLVPYRRFAADHPDGRVLQPPGGESEAASDGETPEPIRYDQQPYADYFESAGYGLDAHRGTGGRADWDRDDLGPKATVLGLEVGGDALGVPRPVVEAAGGVVQPTVGSRSVAVFATPDGLHGFFDDGLGFEPSAEPGRFRADGATWDGATGESDDGRALERAPARRLFAFAWRDDHGPDAFYEG
ncbi:MAG: DUF3179 domain-containing protein [Halobacteriales archaeon]